MPKQIPVYLFVGQLESGKTKFIQETMEDPNFDSGDKTLLLVCEEGEIEYDPKKFAFGGVHVAQIEDKSELTQENLTALEKKSGCGRVIIEYNGMWLVQELYDAMPDNWLVYQCLATADGTTIKTYAGDSAMRSLLLDKIRGSELLVVNRAEAVNDDESRQLIHKLVRQASRRCDIAYEFADGSVAYDDIPDPLPFDVDAPVIEEYPLTLECELVEMQDQPYGLRVLGRIVNVLADEKVLDEAIFLKQGKIMLHETVDNIREKEGKSVDALFRELFRALPMEGGEF